MNVLNLFIPALKMLPAATSTDRSGVSVEVDIRGMEQIVKV